ncbi:MAG: response regulator [Thermoanaerobaculia bacterium]
MPPRHLLVVDDEDHVREIACLSLEMERDWTVSSANAGAAGLKLAMSLRPDAIILDVMMPGMDGPTTLRLLRAQEQTRDIPVIFLTAKVKVADKRKLLDLGAHGVIAKPFDPVLLPQMVREILRWDGVRAA